MNKLQKEKERLVVENVSDINGADLKLPDLEVTEKDKERFLECVTSGTPFSQSFEHKSSSLNVVLRDKTKKESEIISRQLDKAYNDGHIYSIAEYTNLFNMGCLYYQLDAINGVKQNRQYPDSIWNMKDFNLMDAIDQSPIGSMSSSVLFLMMAMMSQLNRKLYVLAMGVVDPNFIVPAKAS